MSTQQIVDEIRDRIKALRATLSMDPTPDSTPVIQETPTEPEITEEPPAKPDIDQRAIELKKLLMKKQ